MSVCVFGALRWTLLKQRHRIFVRIVYLFVALRIAVMIIMPAIHLAVFHIHLSQIHLCKWALFRHDLNGYHQYEWGNLLIEYLGNQFGQWNNRNQPVDEPTKQPTKRTRKILLSFLHDFDIVFTFRALAWNSLTLNSKSTWAHFK